MRAVPGGRRACRYPRCARTVLPHPRPPAASHNGTARRPAHPPPRLPAEYLWSVPVVTVLFTLMPWAPLAKACKDLGAATEDDSSVGISWANRKNYCLDISERSAQDAAYVPGTYQDFDCVFPLTAGARVWVGMGGGGPTPDSLVCPHITPPPTHTHTQSSGCCLSSSWPILRWLSTWTMCCLTKTVRLGTGSEGGREREGGWRGKK